jgi:hypothetical protein
MRKVVVSGTIRSEQRNTPERIQADLVNCQKIVKLLRLV